MEYFFIFSYEYWTTWGFLPNLKIKATSKSSRFKFILNIASSKLRYIKLQSSNSILKKQSPDFFHHILQFKIIKNLLKNSKLKKVFTYCEKMRLNRWFWKLKKYFSLSNGPKTTFFSIGTLKTNTISESFPIYRILNFRSLISGFELLNFESENSIEWIKFVIFINLHLSYRKKGSFWLILREKNIFCFCKRTYLKHQIHFTSNYIFQF